ncbi:MAG: prepilin-type N-terminal cleavage/methylation domain-containing protein [Pseudohongiella sp.]|nr:prepilin-type N-terminal cleavage/methylation domain-containing protein [Pseudohongiella sp.]MDO9521774.1 prepilin-type N-terminal cleavage/methylation domain-containing protein [Pseudohongiella sp.]MDP2128386.1 prepilin-type N-terminal cleavage/methylation domain-containing protein [Pseudohongiella sp.]
MFAKGMTLIEVLVASVILGTGILCLLALQTTALGIGLASGHRQQASLLLMELSEITHISPDAFRALDPQTLITGFAGPVQSCRAGTACPVAAFARNELSLWVNMVRDRLPAAKIDIMRELQDGQVIWTVTLSWHGPEGTQQNTLQTELAI